MISNVGLCSIIFFIFVKFPAHEHVIISSLTNFYSMTVLLPCAILLIKVSRTATSYLALGSIPFKVTMNSYAFSNIM